MGELWGIEIWNKSIRCQKITDEGVKNLCEGLKGLENLKEVHFNFFGYYIFNWKWVLTKKRCQMITDQGLENMSQGFKTIQKLQDINLNFEL